MKLEARLKTIEKELGAENSITFKKLISPEFVYKGKPFETTEEIFERLDIHELPEHLSNDELEILYEKGIWKYSIKKTIDAMSNKI